MTTQRLIASGIEGPTATGGDRRFFKSGWVNVTGWIAWVLMFVLPPRIDGPWGMPAFVACSITATVCFVRVLLKRRRAGR